MLKRTYIFALVSFLLIPVATLLGAMLFNAINPEIAAGHANYVRNYRLLEQAKNLCIQAVLLANLVLWFLTCYFLLKSKQRSYAWLGLALLGPFGFVGLAMLGDNAPTPGDVHHRLMRKLHILLRIAYELGMFLLAWVVAYQAMVLKRNLMIEREAVATGLSTAQIVDIQSASSGMWAFSEGLETMYLLVLFYLLWPLAVNAVGRLSRAWTAARQA